MENFAIVGMTTGKNSKNSAENGKNNFTIVRFVTKGGGAVLGGENGFLHFLKKLRIVSRKVQYKSCR